MLGTQLAKHTTMKNILLNIIAGISLISAAHPPQEMVYKCSTLSRMIEIEEGLPPLLLSAVTFIESSDMPWVIGVEGAAHRFYTKQGALNKIKELRAQGKTNFDIGCMQVNHFFHKNNFASDEDMLHPVHNIRYAARLLKQLQAETGSWEKAVAYYNSRDLRYSAGYTAKVHQHWNKIKSGTEAVIDPSSFAHTPKPKLNVNLSIPQLPANSSLQRAKFAYLTYKKTLVRK